MEAKAENAQQTSEPLLYPRELNAHDVSYMQFGPLGIAVIIAPIALLNLTYHGAVNNKLDLGQGILLLTVVSILSVFIFAGGVVGIIFAARLMHQDMRLFEAFTGELQEYAEKTYGFALSREEAVRLLRGFSVDANKDHGVIKLSSRSEEQVKLLDFHSREELLVS